MSTATNPMGLKRICTNCGGRFYDLNKRPINCPSCDTEFTGEVKAKGRRGRAAVAEVKKEEPVKVAVVEEEVLEEEDDGVEVVSLDDAEVEKKDTKETGDDDDSDDDLKGVPDFGDDTVDDIGADDNALLDEDED